PLAPECECQDRHVVNGARLHQRRRCARRDQVQVRIQLLVQPHDALLFVLPHQEANNRHGHAGAGGRIDILHARDLPQQFLHRLRDALLHFARRRAGHLHENVDHRHDDLRLLLARQLPHREAPQQQRAGDHQRRQLRPDPNPGERSRGTQFALHLHWRTSTLAPSARPCGTGKITFSPALRPESTSTPSLTFCPAVISRMRAMPLSATKTDCNWPRSVTAPAGISSSGRLPSWNSARPKTPERSAGRAGRSILTVYAREAASTAGTISETRASMARSTPSNVTDTGWPTRIAAKWPSSTDASRRYAPSRSIVNRAAPGRARLPGSTDLAMTTPAKGARTSA